MRRSRKLLTILCLLMLALSIALTSCGSAQSKKIESLDQMEHSTLGILTGSSFDRQTRASFPDAEYKYLNLFSDLIQSLLQGKIDGFVVDTAFYAPMRWETNDIGYISMPDAESADFGFVYGNSEFSNTIKTQMDEFITKMSEDGTLEQLSSLWTGESEPQVDIDFPKLSGENGVIRVVTCPDSKPFDYIKNGSFYGFDMDILYRFCEEYGYSAELTGVTFEAILPGIQKYDIGMAGITMTPERKESVNFSIPYYTSGIVMVIRNDETSKTGFFDSIAESIDKTFVRENRWQLIASGIGVTLLITVFSMILGTALGFGIYMLCRNGNGFILGVFRVYSRILSGTPVVVLLMVLFYVIFGKSTIDGMWVAIVAFSMNLSVFVFESLGVCVEGIDFGQTEAALALGYNRNQAFFKIVLPQAARQFFPGYQSEIVSLVKATAVVGYIAVQDLTKMSDIIRSSTYEAFFPLISTAAIYFLLTWGVSALVGLVKVRLEPKRRSGGEILKGVKTK